jgi:hypothetical protein
VIDAALARIERHRAALLKDERNAALRHASAVR